jgi:hypothetical protein
MTKMGVRGGRSPYANDLVVVGESDFFGCEMQKNEIYLFIFLLTGATI